MENIPFPADRVEEAYLEPLLPEHGNDAARSSAQQPSNGAGKAVINLLNATTGDSTMAGKALFETVSFSL
jgi:hypothetical protein